MNRVVIADGRTAVSLSDPVRTSSPDVEFLAVTIDGPHLSAMRQVYEGRAGGFETLVSFLNGLAQDWRGWPGAREYSSVEGDLHIRVTHDGHVTLQLMLCESAQPHGWRVEATVRLDADEQLTRAAADIAHLVRSP